MEFLDDSAEPLIAGIAEIATAKSSQQFGREEEKEK